VPFRGNIEHIIFGGNLPPNSTFYRPEWENPVIKIFPKIVAAKLRITMLGYSKRAFTYSRSHLVPSKNHVISLFKGAYSQTFISKGKTFSLNVVIERIC
jgi:hypothetical protein